METNYSLALKQFINKNFAASFRLASELFHKCFTEYSGHSISLTLLTKIINLYLVEVGVCLKDGLLNQVQANTAVNSITSNEVINQIHAVFGDEIPCEILYNYHLMHITNSKLLINDNYWDQLRNDYHHAINDKYKQKFIELVVFEILPRYDKYKEAEQLITNPNDLQRLRKIQEKQKLAEEVERSQKKTPPKEQPTLKYKSIKEIQNAYNLEEAKKPTLPESRLLYIYNLVKNYLRDNYLVVLVLIILGLGARKYLSRANLREKIVDTIKMAFKFSYI